MNALALVRSHSRLSLLALMRSPAYVVPTIAFPALFYMLFDLQYARSQAAIADYTTLAFIAFAVIGVALYQFGIGIAQERGRPWERYQRTLSASPMARFSARIVSASLFALLAAAVVAIVSRALTPIDLTVAQWMTTLVYAALGGVPFVLMGITLGYFASPRASVPLATMLNLLLAYAGGLWMPPQFLPDVVQRISPFLPTRQLADLLWSVPRGGDVSHAVVGLVLYTCVFGVLATIGYRRDEKARYA